MSRKKNNDDIPYSFVSLTSKLQHPSLEIDLKTICLNSSTSKHRKKRNSTSSQSPTNSVLSDSNYKDTDTSSILRPITVDSLTPTISKSYKHYNKTNDWDETPIKRKRSAPSPMEYQITKHDKVINNDFHSNDKKYNDFDYDNNSNENNNQNNEVVIEEEEEDNSINSDVSEEFVDKQSIDYLDKLINKIKNKGQDAKNSSINSLNFQYPPSVSSSSKKSKKSSHSQNKAKTFELPARRTSKESLQEQIAEQSNQKIITLKNKCYGLNKYLEENGYNDAENESEHKLTDESNEYNSDSQNGKLTRNSNRKNYIVNKENYQICDVRECDYEFEQQNRENRNFQHFFIFNVGDPPKSNNSIVKRQKEKTVDSAPFDNVSSNPQTSKNNNKSYSNKNECNTSNNPNNNVNDSCSISFSNSSSNSAFSSPSRNTSHRSLHSPRLSPQLQKMKENSSSRGTSPETKKLRDKAIGNIDLSMKDNSVWCQIEDEEEDDNFDVECKLNSQGNNQRQLTPTRNSVKSRIIRINQEDNEDMRYKNRTFDRNDDNFLNEVQNKSGFKGKEVNTFSRLSSNSKKSINRSGKKTNDDVSTLFNSSNIKVSINTERKHPIYAEHFAQTDDVSNEDEL
ncbi:hypothetical protein M9Y10_034838 [Tritrichomonas musculus]|uniref:Uncharacterized protein n=1 Tax=Tritrichomonas musculus TaxID=1915356 RepID=A0ABR2KG18_9EUKA